MRVILSLHRRAASRTPCELTLAHLIQLVFLILAWTSWLVRTSCFAWLCFLQHCVIQLLGWQPGRIPLRHMHRTFPYSSKKRHRGRRSSKRSLRRKIRRYFKRHAVPFLTHLVLSCAWSLVLRCLSGVTHRCQSWLLLAHGNVSHPARLVPPPTPLPRCTSRTFPVRADREAREVSMRRQTPRRQHRSKP